MCVFLSSPWYMTPHGARSAAVLPLTLMRLRAEPVKRHGCKLVSAKDSVSWSY